MRAFALMVAAALAVMPVMAPAARADGIERPHAVRHHRPRPHRHVELVAPTPVITPRGREAVILPAAFFSGGGGVGTDIGTAAVYSSTVIIRGVGASASAFAFSSARSSVGVGGHSGGGCGCR